jgi:predicted anti-sigma-YlaC factor YlaD
LAHEATARDPDTAPGPPGELTVHCERCRELLSARLDGETSPLEDAAIDRHVDRCAPCASHASSLRRLAGSGHAAAPGVAANALLDRLGWSPDAEAPVWARYGLLTIALAEIVLAIPQLLAHGKGLFVHDLHHLGAWDLALGVGLLVVAWQPERARGLLPTAGALAVGMAITAVVDIVDGKVPPWSEAHHVLEIAGVVCLWVVGRSFRLRPRPLWRPWNRSSPPGATADAPSTPVPLARRGPG